MQLKIITHTQARSPEAEWHTSIHVQVPHQARQKSKAVLQTAKENRVIPMRRNMQTSLLILQEDHCHTTSPRSGVPLLLYL